MALTKKEEKKKPIDNLTYKAEKEQRVITIKLKKLNQNYFY